MKWIKASEICCYSMTLSYFLGEVIELWDEVKKGDIEGMKSEALDVYSCFAELVYNKMGWDVWVIENKSIRAWARRVEIWEKWLGCYGLTFKREYMQYGTNFKRREKRHRILEMARKDKGGAA
jgi:hypothetical protein